MMRQARQVRGSTQSILQAPTLINRAIGTMLKAQWSVFQKLDVLKSIRAAAPHAPRLWAVSLDKQRVTA
jgi:hypothetical protein